MSDIDTAARTIFGEARGEGRIGMQAVMNVIKNRATFAEGYKEAHGKNHPLYGDGQIETACLMPWQFSCWNHNDPNRDIIIKVDEHSPVFADALKIATDVISGELDDITHNATHYYDSRLPDPPEWAEGHLPCAAIKHHFFYNDID